MAFEQNMVIGTVITVVIGVVGLTIITDVVAGANSGAGFTGTLGTVTENIGILFGVGLLVAAVAWALYR